MYIRYPAWRRQVCWAHPLRDIEAMMTIVATLKQQHRNVLDYLTATCEGALRGEPAPSLLPSPNDLEKLMRSAA